EVKRLLKRKDGNTHVILLEMEKLSFLTGYDEEYTTKTDEILSQMQNDGYEIVDIRFSTGIKGDLKQSVDLETLIIYK
ncbi:hypothetical protein, partial [Escherichia coli]